MPTPRGLIGRLIVGAGPPNPEDCRQVTDIGNIYHDEVDDIWYECLHDTRRDVTTWAISPPNDPTEGAG